MIHQRHEIYRTTPDAPRSQQVCIALVLRAVISHREGEWIGRMFFFFFFYFCTCPQDRYYYVEREPCLGGPTRNSLPFFLCQKSPPTDRQNGPGSHKSLRFRGVPVFRAANSFSFAQTSPRLTSVILILTLPPLPRREQPPSLSSPLLHTTGITAVPIRKTPPPCLQEPLAARQRRLRFETSMRTVGNIRPPTQRPHPI